MILGVALLALVVRDYEEAKAFYCEKLGFTVAEDTALGNKRWIRLRAPGEMGAEILLSKAVSEEQRFAVGRQAGGRVLFFMHTNNLSEDYNKLRALGVKFTEEPRAEPYGLVAVFCDLYGNRIDLIEPTSSRG
jgi:predicted enzyme related to lactoylglutathione lyase